MTPTTTRIRQATERDLAAIAAIDRRCFPRAFGAEEWQTELARPSTLLLVAADGPRAAPVGYCLLWRVADELHLQRLATAAARRRRGIGRALLQEVIARGRSDGQRWLLLEVGADNAPALALYRAAGCTVVGRRARYYADGEDALLLTLDLRAGAGPAVR